MLEFIKFEKNKMGDILIKIGKMNYFRNVCKVSGEAESINLSLEYIPNDRLLELQSLRNFVKEGFNDLIENICVDIHNKLFELLKPKYLKVTIYMDDLTLTPWTVEKETELL